MGSHLSVYILGAVLILTVLYLIRDQVDKKRRNVGGPTPVPFLGNLLPSIINGVEGREKMWEGMFDTYGDTFIFRGFATNVIFTKNPDNVKFVTSTNFNNFKRMDQKNQNFVFRAIRALFGEGIFVADDEVWEIQRKVAGPLFKKDSLDNMKIVFSAKAESVLELLSGFSKNDTEFDIQKIFHEYTLDSFSEIGFGMSVDSLHHDLKFPYHFDRAQRIMISLFSNPFLQWFGTQKSEFFESTAFIQKYFYDSIENHTTDGPDLMSKFLSLKDADGKPYPKKWIVDILINFAIAGRDTTALLLTWTVYALLTNPRVETKLRREIETKLGSTKANSSNIDSLTYLDHVLKETLRLYPSVPLTGRFAANDTVLPTGAKVNAGDRVVYFQKFLHKDPRYWKDPEEFKPERWAVEKPCEHPFQYMAFHAGPMQCLGRHMALIEAKILLVKLLQQFKLELNKDHKVFPFFGAVMPAWNGIRVKVKEIN